MGDSDSKLIISGSKRAATYARISAVKKRKPVGDTQEDDTRSFEQRPEIQIEALTALAKQRGWTVAKVYQDRASGAKEKRPGLHCSDDRRPPRSFRYSTGMAVRPIRPKRQTACART